MERGREKMKKGAEGGKRGRGKEEIVKREARPEKRKGGEKKESKGF